MTSYGSIERCEYFFDLFVKKDFPSKNFNSTRVNRESRGGCDLTSTYYGPVQGSESFIITYSHDDVEIRYYERCTHHLGDYDMFYDIKIEVDGKVICDVKFQ